MTRLVVILAIGASALAFSPQPAAAGCTEDYMTCLNDTWHLKGALKTMADIECFAEYTGCVRRSLLGL